MAGRVVGSPESGERSGRRPLRTLAGRVGVLASLTVVLTAMTIAAFVVGSEFSQSRERLRAQGESIAGILAQNADFALMARDDPQLVAFAQSAFAEPAVLYVAFHDAEGRSVVTEPRPGVSVPPPGIAPEAGGGGRPLVRERPGSGDADDVLEVATVVRSPPPTGARGAPPQGLGFVRVGLSLELARSRVRAFAWTIALLTLGLMAVGVALATLLARHIARPLERLQAAARDVAAGSLDASVEGGDTVEVDELAQAFRRMLASLRASREEVARRTEELEAKNSELERFTYTVSHDLKSPLITITGFLDFVEQAAAAGDTDAARRDLERIRNAARRMYGLLEQLLELSRIGRITNASESVPVEELASEARQLVGGHIAVRRAEVEIAPGLPVVWGDRQRLLEVLQNLLDNAVRFADPGQPRVRVASRAARDGWVGFAVSDNGPGVPARYAEKVFVLFEKLDADGDGTGVGLALVKRIVEHHGGRTWVEPGPLGGASLCVELPALPAEDGR